EERTAQIAAANKELDSFAYSVSHDLRAPLRGIDGFSQALLEDYGERLDDTAKDYISRVRAGCLRMGDLIDDMLQLSRLSRGEIHRQEVDLSAMAGEIAEELQRGAPARRVVFELTPGITVFGDAILLRAVLDNLLGNAWKFTAKTEEARITFGRQEEDGKDLLFVRDNGAGFDMAYADKLFGAFQRLHSPQEFEGTGIGLATVQRIIHRHGGTIRAEGAVGSGATFYFSV
ncbi:MAG: ATP-binding protein, partial [Desulfurivibrionaceae bacterium]